MRAPLRWLAEGYPQSQDWQWVSFRSRLPREIRDRSFLPSAVVGLPDRKCGMVSTYLHILVYTRSALGKLNREGGAAVRHVATCLVRFGGMRLCLSMLCEALSVILEPLTTSITLYAPLKLCIDPHFSQLCCNSSDLCAVTVCGQQVCVILIPLMTRLVSLRTRRSKKPHFS
jgi:hypothetical protein